MKTRNVFAVAALLLASQAGAVNLITNGSFEDGQLVPNYVDPGARMIGPNDSVTLAGWTTLNSGLDISWIGLGNPYNITASDGNNFLDLTGWHDQSGQGAGVMQTIATTAGMHYTLTFDQGNSARYNPGSTDTLHVTAGDQVNVGFTVAPTDQPSVWTQQTLSFTATGSSTTVSFVGGQAIYFIGLDNVSVVAAPVPEPTEALMLGTGLLGLALVARRRRS